MKKRFYLTMLAVLGMAALFSSCKDEVPTPETQNTPTPVTWSPEVIDINYAVVSENEITIRVETLEMDSMRINYGFDSEDMTIKKVYSDSRDTLDFMITLDKTKASSRANTDYLNVWITNIENGEVVEYRNHELNRVFVDWAAIAEFYFHLDEPLPTTNGCRIYFDAINPSLFDAELRFEAIASGDPEIINQTIFVGSNLINEYIEFVNFQPEQDVNFKVFDNLTGDEINRGSFTTRRIHFYENNLVGPGSISENKNEQSLGSVILDADGNVLCDKMVITFIDSLASDTAFLPWEYFLSINVGDDLKYARHISDWDVNKEQSSITIPLQETSIGKDFASLVISSATHEIFPRSETIWMQVTLYYQNTETLETNQVLVSF